MRGMTPMRGINYPHEGNDPYDGMNDPYDGMNDPHEKK